MKHTPGPWKISCDSPLYPFSVVTEKDDDHICEIRLPNAKANARLIAAAPKMYEALQAIMARLNGEFDHPALVALGPLMTTDADIGTLAENAIRQVEGR